MRFEFATAGRIVFGRGALAQAGALAAACGSRACVVTGGNRDRAAPLLEQLARAGVTPTVFPVTGEPTTDAVARGTAAARAADAQFVVAFGGGSVIDAGKAIAALFANPGDVLDYLEVVGRGRPLAHPGLPCIAIPTTAGTGSEVTRNAVLASPEHRVKASLRGPQLLPRVAVVDPQLTDTLPPALTASTGLDALTQLIEPYVSSRANPLVDGLCTEGIVRAARSLPRACAEGAAAPGARDDMAFASLCGGLALANAGLGAVHGFAAPIGGMFDAPHGAVCAALLPFVMAANLHALRSRAREHPALARFDVVARLLTGSATATADDCVRWVRELTAALRIPPLQHYGIGAHAHARIVTAAAQASSMKANPLPLTEEELAAILRAAASGSG